MSHRTMLSLGLVCADGPLRQRAVQALARLPSVQLSWFVCDVPQARAQVRVPLLLVAAAQCSRRSLVELAADGRTQIIALADNLQRDCDVLYAALDAGAAGHLELDDYPDVHAMDERLHQLRWLHQPSQSAMPPLLAIGASAGGPAALLRILGALPVDLVAAVLVVQHYEGADIEDFCAWLRPHVALPVHAALDGSVPRPGEVLIAQSGQHLVLSASRRLECRARACGDLHCPSVDALFHSLALHAAPAVAMLLTGMGQDGAVGLLALRKAGWQTLVQDAASSAVDGMPRSARELDAACQVLDLAQLAPQAVRALAAVGRS